MIPKIIHYCWFGKNPMPKLSLDCVKSWKKFLPDYKIILWNEDNFDVSSNPYTKEAYEAKKWAFITDYVRLYVLYHYGGIYMDVDVEVIRNIDEFLTLPAFSGFENEKAIPTGIMASEQGGVWAKKMLAYYDNKHFLKEDGTPDLITNVQIITDLMLREGFIPNDTYQNINDEIHFFPHDYFCPMGEGLRLVLTENTYTIHHFAASWYSRTDKIKRKIWVFINRYSFTKNLYLRLKKIENKKHMKPSSSKNAQGCD